MRDPFRGHSVMSLV